MLSLKASNERRIVAIVESVSAQEILDSRGRPTVRATCVLPGGAQATADTPSGASTGAAEAWELRDGDPQRYGGRGCRRAAEHVNGEINEHLRGNDWTQGSLDRALIALDGTPNKSRLGANALLATSLAFARAVAVQNGLPLYQHFAAMIGGTPRTMPRLTVNLFSGGKHAGAQVAIQDVLLVPVRATTVDESLSMIAAVYQAAAKLIEEKYDMRMLRADEGGLAPPCASAGAMLEDAVQAIEAAGLTPGIDMALAVDVASSHFYTDRRYTLDGESLDSRSMIEHLSRWVNRFPIVSIEDGLAEDDWEGWPGLKAWIGGRALVLGDDFLCTNPARIQRAVEGGCANALLLKVNQVGTVSEAAEACRLARLAGWKVTVSARSGETEDTWLADLAVGWSGDQIKIGSITQSERLAKYNRLLEIERAEGWPTVQWPGKTESQH
jgi:enolase